MRFLADAVGDGIEILVGAQDGGVVPMHRHFLAGERGALGGNGRQEIPLDLLGAAALLVQFFGVGAADRFPPRASEPK